MLLDQSRLADFARKGVGGGRGRAQAWIALQFGRGGSDSLLLQMKEAEASVLKEHVGKSWSQTTADALWRSAAAAGGPRHLPRLGAHDVEARRSATRLLRPPAQGPEGLRGDQSN